QGGEGGLVAPLGEAADQLHVGAAGGVGGEQAGSEVLEGGGKRSSRGHVGPRVPFSARYFPGAGRFLHAISWPSGSVQLDCSDVEPRALASASHALAKARG